MLLLMTSIVILFTVFTPFGHSCISSLVSGDLVPGFSINSITPIFVADYVSLSGMESFMNHFIFSSLVMYCIMVQQIFRK